MWPILFEIPIPFVGIEIPVHSFGVMVALGFLVASSLVSRYARRYGDDPERDPERFQVVSLWVLVGVVVGARLLYVAVHPAEFAGSWLDLLAIWKGGLVFYGGFVGGIAFGAWKAKKLGMNLLSTADLAIAAAFVGIGIGRIGCLLVGDDYGRPAPEGLPFPLAVRVPEDLVTPPFDRSQWDRETAGKLVYATQVWLSANAFALAILARYLLERRRFAGQLAATVTAVYCVVRFAVEFFRGDDAARGMVLDGSLSTSQAISIPLFALCLVALARGRRAATARAA
jgi:phosphatidylglycerol:prolipoprotein diacylglycerol transferase